MRSEISERWARAMEGIPTLEAMASECRALANHLGLVHAGAEAGDREVFFAAGVAGGEAEEARGEQLGERGTVIDVSKGYLRNYLIPRKLAQPAFARQRVLMIAGPALRTIPVTIHMPLRDVPDALSIELIRTRALVTVKGLCRNFGIAKPRLVVAGLNPHAGESGNLGREEIEIIAPAIESLRAEGMDISGPYAPDGMFHEPMRDTYDAALCMYHDQALIPAP